MVSNSHWCNQSHWGTCPLTYGHNTWKCLWQNRWLNSVLLSVVFAHLKQILTDIIIVPIEFWTSGAEAFTYYCYFNMYSFIAVGISLNTKAFKGPWFSITLSFSFLNLHSCASHNINQRRFLWWSKRCQKVNKLQGKVHQQYANIAAAVGLAG